MALLSCSVKGSQGWMVDGFWYVKRLSFGSSWRWFGERTIKRYFGPLNVSFWWKWSYSCTFVIKSNSIMNICDFYWVIYIHQNRCKPQKACFFCHKQTVLKRKSCRTGYFLDHCFSICFILLQVLYFSLCLVLAAEMFEKGTTDQFYSEKNAGCFAPNYDPEKLRPVWVLFIFLYIFCITLCDQTKSIIYLK